MNEENEHDLASLDDRDLKALFRDAAPTAGFEDRVIARLRASSSRQTRLRIHPAVYRSAAAAAAIAVVAGVGYVATRQVESPTQFVELLEGVRHSAKQVPTASAPSFAAAERWDFGGGSNTALRWNDDASPSRQSRKVIDKAASNRPAQPQPQAGALPNDIKSGFEENPFVDVQRDAVRELTDKSKVAPAEQSRLRATIRTDANNAILLPSDDDAPKTESGFIDGIAAGKDARFKPGDFSIAGKIASSGDDQTRAKEEAKRPALKEESGKVSEKPGRAQQEAASAAASTPAEPAPPTTTTFQRKVIRNGEIEFEVDAFDATVSRLTSVVIEEGGFIATTNSDKLPNGKVRGVIVVRISPDRLDALVLKLRALGDLKSQNLTAQDVTKQYSDLESELRAARAMETRLLEMIKSGAGSIKDLLAAEKELGVWREKIEKTTGEINYYNNLVSLSTLQITLTEKDLRAAAAVNETETVDMGVESEDVEKSRTETIAAIDAVKGRIVESQLKQFDAGQLAAKVVADVSRDKAGETIDRLKQLGKVARLDVQRQTTTLNGQPPTAGSRVERADTRISVSFYNLANVAPRVSTTMNLACDDVEAAYRTILSRIGKAPGGRVISSNLNRQQGAAGASASISFETKTDAADAALADVRTSGEVMKLDSTENADTTNVTTAKRGFTLTLVSSATATPRQVSSSNIAAADVVKSYEAILSAARKANARIVVSRIDQQSGRPTTATLDFEIRRTETAAIDGTLALAGDAVASNVFVNADSANTLESKVAYHLALAPADSLPPRESTGMSIETNRVDDSAASIAKNVNEIGGRVVDSSVSKQADGRTSAHLVIDAPLSKSAEVFDRLKSIGTVRSQQSTRNAQVPAGNLSRVRFDVTLADPESLVSSDSGLFSTLRRGLSTSAAGLLWSLQLIVVGLCLVAPWAIVLWGGWRLTKRFRKSRATVA